MSRNTAYMFVSEDVESIITRKKARFEELSGRVVLPSSPEMLFIRWDAYNELVLRQAINQAARKNLAFSAEGEDLDRCGEMYYAMKRPEAKPAVCTLQFTLSQATAESFVIPAGTRVTTNVGTPIFETDEDVIVPVGSTTVTATATCQTDGTDGNGIEAGGLSVLVDPFTYYEAVENTGVTDGGSNEATDDEYYALMISGQAAYSTAGSVGAYKYMAQSVSTEIADVCVNSPSAGTVDIYALMSDGTIASATMKALILQECSSEENRPLTDYVRVRDPDQVTYNISLTYYLLRNSAESASVLVANIESAVAEYVTWQSEKLGRDINPDELVQMIKSAGAKRVVISSPTYTQLRNGQVSNPESADPEDYIPQIAKIGTIELINGGYEDE